MPYWVGDNTGPAPTLLGYGGGYPPMYDYNYTPPQQTQYAGNGVQHHFIGDPSAHPGSSDDPMQSLYTNTNGPQAPYSSASFDNGIPGTTAGFNPMVQPNVQPMPNQQVPAQQQMPQQVPQQMPMYPPMQPGPAQPQQFGPQETIPPAPPPGFDGPYYAGKGFGKYGPPDGGGPDYAQGKGGKGFGFPDGAFGGNQAQGGNHHGFQQPPGNGFDMSLMFQALTNSALSTNQAVKDIGLMMSKNCQNQEAKQGYRSLKPKREMTKLTAVEAKTLMNELMDFELDLRELGVVEMTETAFFQLRASVAGEAKDIVELAMQDPGNKNMESQALNAPDGARFNRDLTQGPGYARQSLFAQLYQNVVLSLRQRKGLTDEKIRDLAIDSNRKARMVRDTPEDANVFLRDYRKTLLAEMRANIRPDFGNLLSMPGVGQNPSAHRAIMHMYHNEQHKLIHEFTSRCSSSVVKFIKGQMRRPKTVDECEALVMMWIEMEVEGRKKIAGGGQINEIGPSDSVSQGATFDSLAPPGSVPPAPAPYQDPDGMIAAFQRSTANRSAGTRFGARPISKSLVELQGPKCPSCQGHHPDLNKGGKCPNYRADQDADYKSNKDLQSKRCHWRVFRKFPCGGVGHLAKHHRLELESTGQKISPAGGGRGGFRPKGRGKGKRINGILRDIPGFGYAVEPIPEGDVSEWYDDGYEENYA